MGYETSAHSFAWSLYHLARKPSLADRFHREVDGVEICPEAPNAELARLPLTEAIIQETLRTHPPVPGMARVAVNDDVMCGYRIRAGTSVLMSIVGTHHHAPVWPDPEHWDPDRFESNDVRLKDGSWIPFGYGPKICIGNTMTMYSMLIFLALIGQRLRFGLVDDDPVLPQRHAATAGPSRHFRFEVERRTRGIHHA